ncbi:hypothetical protein AB0D99_13605 [Streptomyces sp. NPDC047971]|uniref:hypothetical protein n=1 Tax=Streptomyces sp. NPDC047971 TaxID=3154499 RepID=UPI0033F5EEBC
MEQGKDEKKKRIDLSVAQVSGSAVAAVVAAKLASTLGVYGTILGAGVISVIATCGGSLFHHLFTRTGEQLREAAGPSGPGKAGEPAARRPAPDRTRTLTAVGGPGKLPHAREFGAGPGGEFGEATTHGTRVRGWKRSGIAAALVFLVAMGGITTYELISDQDFSGTKGSTTFGSVVRGDGGGRAEPSTGTTPSHRPGTERQPERDTSGGAAGTPSPDSGGTAPAPTPTPSRSTGGDPAPTPTPTPTPTDTAPTPGPSATPSTGTGAGGQAASPAE